MAGLQAPGLGAGNQAPGPGAANQAPGLGTGNQAQHSQPEASKAMQKIMGYITKVEEEIFALDKALKAS